MTAYNGQTLLGFSYGYGLERAISNWVNFHLIRSTLSQAGICPQKTFYGAETDVLQEYRRQGIACLLLQKRSKKSEFDFVAFRTKNPDMLQLYNKAFGTSILQMDEESTYVGGKVYVYITKKNTKY